MNPTGWKTKNRGNLILTEVGLFDERKRAFVRPILRGRWGRRRDREGDDRAVAAMNATLGR